jgi:Large polyvalent protein associated domain 29
MTNEHATSLSCAETAKLLRAALKEVFATTKFSVRSDNYAGGASIDVRWVDGPTSKDVQRICKQFDGADFDGMQDLKTYKTQLVNGKPIQYGADFVFAKRILPAAFLTKIAQDYCNQFGYEIPRIIDHRTDAYTSHKSPHTGEIMRRALAASAAVGTKRKRVSP